MKLNQSSQSEIVAYAATLPLELSHQIIDDLPLSVLLTLVNTSKDASFGALLISHGTWRHAFENRTQLDLAVSLFACVQRMKEALSDLPKSFVYDIKMIGRFENDFVREFGRSAATWPSRGKGPSFEGLMSTIRTYLATQLDHIRQVYGKTWLRGYKPEAFPKGTDALVKDLARLDAAVKDYGQKKGEIETARKAQVQVWIELLTHHPYMFRQSSDPHQVVRPNKSIVETVKWHTGALSRNPETARRRLNRTQYLFRRAHATFVPYDFLILYLVRSLDNPAFDSLREELAEDFRMVKETIERRVVTRGPGRPYSRNGTESERLLIQTFMDSFAADKPEEKFKALRYYNISSPIPDKILGDMKTAVYGLSHDYLLQSSYYSDWTAYSNVSSLDESGQFDVSQKKQRSKIFEDGVDDYEAETFPAELCLHRWLLPRDTSEMKWLQAFARAVMYLRDHVNTESKEYSVRERHDLET